MFCRRIIHAGFLILAAFMTPAAHAQELENIVVVAGDEGRPTLSPSGKILTLGTRLYNAKTGKELALETQPTLDLRGGRVVFSRDEKHLLVQDDKTVHLLDVKTGKELIKPLSFPDEIRAATFGPDGKILVACKQEVTFWDPKSGKKLATLVHQEVFPDKDPQVNSVALSPDGKTILTGTFGHATLWTSGGKLIGRVQHQGLLDETPQFSASGNTFLTKTDFILGGWALQLWKTDTRKPFAQPIVFPADKVLAPGVQPVLSRDGKLLASVLDESTEVCLWDLKTSKAFGPVLKHKGEITALAFSYDHKYLLVGSKDKTATLWQVSTGKRVAAPLPHPEPVVWVAFNPDNEICYTHCKSQNREDNRYLLWQLPRAKKK